MSKAKSQASQKPLYIHLQGRSVGPFSQDEILTMLQQNRLQFVDYIWAEHLTKWHRVMDLDEFAGALPSYPKISIPQNQSESQPILKSVPAGPEPSRGQVQAPTSQAPTSQAQRTPPKTSDEQKHWEKPRTYTRVPAQGLQVEFVQLGSFPIVNISEGGMFLRSKKSPEIGTDVQLSMKIEMGKTLQMTGVVIRHGVADGVEGFAVEFTRINPAHRRFLQAYVENATQSK